MKLKFISTISVMLITAISFAQNIQEGSIISYERTEKGKVELIESFTNANKEIITVVKEYVKGPGSFSYFLRKETLDHKLISNKNITSEVLVKGGALEKVLIGNEELVFVLSEIVKKTQFFQVRKYNLATEQFSEKIKISERIRTNKTKRYHVGAAISPNKEKIFVGIVPRYNKKAETYKEFVLLDNNLNKLWASNGIYYETEKNYQRQYNILMKRTELNFLPEYVVNNKGEVFGEEYEVLSSISKDGAKFQRIKSFNEKYDKISYYSLGLRNDGNVIVSGGCVDAEADKNLLIGYKVFNKNLELISTATANLNAKLNSDYYSLITKAIEVDNTGEITLISYLFELDIITVTTSNGTSTKYVYDFDDIYVTKFDNSSNVVYNTLVRRGLRTGMRQFPWLYYKKDGIYNFVYKDPIKNRGMKSNSDYVPLKGVKKSELIKVSVDANGSVKRKTFFDYRAENMVSFKIYSLLTATETGIIVSDSKKNGWNFIYCE